LNGVLPPREPGPARLKLRGRQPSKSAMDDDAAAADPLRAKHRFRKRSNVGVHGRLVGLITLLAALSIACVGVAVAGMLTTRTKASDSHTAFVALEFERSAYEGWIYDADQSNAAVAAQSLHQAGGGLSWAVPPGTLSQMVRADWQVVDFNYGQAIRGVNWLSKHAPTAALRAEAAHTRTDLRAYNSYTQRVHRLTLAGKVTRATAIVTVDEATSSAYVQGDFVSMDNTLSRGAKVIAASVGGGVNRALMLVTIIGLAALLFAVILTVAVVRSITVPLRAMTESAKRLSQGDVDVAIDIDSTDEIGQMASAFRGIIEYRQEMAAAAREIAAGNLTVAIAPKSENDILGVAFADMRTRIADMLRQISSSSRTVGGASQQIARSGQQTGMAVTEIAHAVGSVAQGAEMQVRSLAEARQVTEEVATASEVSAVEAQETAAAARQTRVAAEVGAAAVERATDVMRAVQASSGEITRTIHELGATSEQIGGIVDTITAVTKQTNLLALNAAIEAARAGEQGRGFAVVAEHVRELAEQSQQAAALIAGLVSKIQAETGAAVQVVVDGARQTEEGVSTVEQAREAFLRIDASVADMDGRVERIAASIGQIANSGARMRDSVDEVLAVAEQSSASAQQVSATAENTSATTQEIAASAQSLAGTAEELERLVSHFTLA
jgi:methyl-accepting chemotaxis protein